MGLAVLSKEDLPHYTYDDYVQWEGRWELIHGIAYAMTPAPTLKHQELSFKIGLQLYHALKDSSQCKSFMAVDWQVTEDTVVRPDNLVVCGHNISGTRLTIPPVLVFEILSPSTSRQDKILKYKLYEKTGIKYYCIVDPESPGTDLFEFRQNKYEKTEDFKNGKMIFDLNCCLINFDFNELFKS